MSFPIARPASPTRAGLSAVLLAYFLGVILVITLAPFQFQVPREFVLDRQTQTFDIVANILLFVPLGFLFPLTRPAEREPSPVEVLGLGMLLSAAIETTQLFEPLRFPSPVDVAANAIGALLGALAMRFATRRVRIDARHVGRFSLEIPLVGLIYLLVPLLLVLSLHAATDPLYLLALAPVVFVLARLLSSVQRHHFAPSGFLTDVEVGVAASVLTLLGTFPMLVARPVAAGGLVLIAGLATWMLASRERWTSPDRRFEAATLHAIRPLIGVQLVCVALLPLANGVSRWTMRASLTGTPSDIDRQLLALLVPVATLTVLGYLLAEARGRREESFRVAARRIAVECGAIALILEACRGFQPEAGASIAQWLLTLGAGVLGAGIYHSQRDHVRWILANRSG